MLYKGGSLAGSIEQGASSSWTHLLPSVPGRVSARCRRDRRGAAGRRGSRLDCLAKITPNNELENGGQPIVVIGLDNNQFWSPFS
jgi:hypothetical protein